MSPIEVRLEKKEELNGAVWYLIHENSVCIKAFEVDTNNPEDALNRATDYYNYMVSRLEMGFPKTEVISSHKGNLPF